jgi:hypothetical protein
MIHRIPILLLMIFFAGKLYSQEVQVPFDSSGKITVITEEMENHLQLFPDYPHFHEARLFRQNDNDYILEVTSLDGEKLSRTRLPRTKQDVIILQKNLAEAVSERSLSILLDQSSRSKFLVWETLLSVGAYGPSILAALQTNNVSVGTGVELIVGGLGFFVPYLLTQHSPMSDGQASLALGGAFLGYGHGALIDLLATNGNPGSEVALLGTFVSISETVIGYSVARATNMSEGKADMIRYGGLFGAVQGAGIGILIDPNPSGSLISGMTLLGSIGGYAAGALLANDAIYTRGNASTVLTAGLFGTYLLPLLYGSVIATAPNFFFSNNTSGSSFERQFAFAAMAGNAGGIVLAHALMKSRHFSTSEGNYVILGTTAGFLVGEGLGLIITSNSSFSSTSSVWTITAPIIIGTAAGFAFMLAILGKGTGDEKNTGWNMNINPGGLMGALSPVKHQTAPNSMMPPPMLSVQYKW